MQELISSSEIISIPSKTFLWGEYSALLGATAAAVTTKPLFYFSKNPIFETATNTVRSKSFNIHPQSPAGLLLEYFKNHFFKNEEETLGGLLSCHIVDPFLGGGGFGRSTAEFIYIYKIFSDKINMNEQSIWNLYRKLVSTPTPPSGYDLMAQLSPGFNIISTVSEQVRINKKPWPFTRLSFLLFKTTQKINTYEHLQSIKIQDLQDVALSSEAVTQTYLQSDQVSFLERVSAFSNLLKSKNLVCDQTMHLCKNIETMDSVEVAKGCGALGADVIAVFCKKQNKTQVLKHVQDHFKEHLSFIASEDDVIFFE